jgi:hypothetical protein
MYDLHRQGKKSAEQETSMQVTCFFETSVHIWISQRYIPEKGNIHNYHCENLKSFKYGYGG